MTLQNVEHHSPWLTTVPKQEIIGFKRHKLMFWLVSILFTHPFKPEAIEGLGILKIVLNRLENIVRKQADANRIPMYGFQRYSNQITGWDSGPIWECKILHEFTFDPDWKLNGKMSTVGDSLYLILTRLHCGKSQGLFDEAVNFWEFTNSGMSPSLWAKDSLNLFPHWLGVFRMTCQVV